MGCSLLLPLAPTRPTLALTQQPNHFLFHFICLAPPGLSCDVRARRCGMWDPGP